MARQPRTQEEVKKRRIALFVGVVIGGLMFLMGRALRISGPPSAPLFFSGWPKWLLYFWPPELALMVFYVWALAFVLVRISPYKKVVFWRLAGGLGLSVAGFSGAITTLSHGWVYGLEVGLMLGGGAAILEALAIAMGNLGIKLNAYFLARQAQRSAQAPKASRQPTRFGTWIRKPGRRLGNWLAAKDVVDPTPPEESSAQS
ncbi:MAG TPA: hypothetical protein VLF91_02450 [Candidatus Saccharimonadales bacterium]|nr:hypothetical protein [Candidatus Saccharimonadales bacterium]